MVSKIHSQDRSVAELYRRWISTVLSTDSDEGSLTGLPSLIAISISLPAIQFCKWIVLEDLSIIVSIKEFTSVITGRSRMSSELSRWYRSRRSQPQKRSGQLPKELHVGSRSLYLFIFQIYACCDLSVSCLLTYLIDIASLTDHDLWADIPVSVSFTLIAARITAVVCILAISG